jgi:hypothetical protein
MLAESAIISGLPAGVGEKTSMPSCFSPRNLYARSFGRPVLLRRTDARGHVREEPAIIRSAPMARRWCRPRRASNWPIAAG